MMTHDETVVIAELAKDAFETAERVRMLLMANTPTDYEERKKAFVDLAIARARASEAAIALYKATKISDDVIALNS